MFSNGKAFSNYAKVLCLVMKGIEIHSRHFSAPLCLRTAGDVRHHGGSGEGRAAAPAKGGGRSEELPELGEVCGHSLLLA